MLEKIMMLSSVLILPSSAALPQTFEKDQIPTSSAQLEISFIGHGSLMFAYGGKVIHIDPYGKLADYSQLPKADLIILTHEHGDHLDPQAIAAISKPDTKIVANASCAEILNLPCGMKNGDTKIIFDIHIEAIPAYNILHKRDNGEPFHPRGVGNGYVLTIDGKRIYVAGDTEDVPEMMKLEKIDVAFLPMNLPFTMSPEMVANAAKAFRPKILYPYHFGQTETRQLENLLKDTPEIEIRIRDMK